MRKILFLFCLILITSCTSKKDFEGFWLSDYQYSLDSTNKLIYGSSILNPKKAIIFKRDSIIEGDFGYSRKGEITRNTYFLWVNNIKINDVNRSSIQPIFISKDSLVLNNSLIYNSLNEYCVYRKLHDSLKVQNKINLTNKAFLLRAEKAIDTLKFENDSTLYVNQTPFSILRIEQKGFDVLLVNMGMVPPLILKEEINNKLKISQIHKGKYNTFELEQINN